MRVEPRDGPAWTMAARRVRAPSIDGVWASMSVLVPGLVILLGTMVAIDLAYQVRAGDLILNARSIPRVDSFTFTMSGRPWLDQQWGAQLLIALAHRAGGWPALSMLRAAIVGASFGLIYRACRVRGATPVAASLLAIAGFVVSLQALAMRPQLFALPLFAGTLLVLVQRDTHPRRLWLIPVMAIAWANLHGSFVMAPALVALASLQDLGRRDRRGAGRLAVVGTCTLVATLVNPFGLHVWTYALALSTNPLIRSSVSEWAPITLSSFAGAGFFATAAASAGWLALRGEKTPWPDLVWLGAFFFLTLPAGRGVIWWGLVAPVVMAGLLPRRARASEGRPGEGEREGEGEGARSGSPMMDLTVVGVLLVATVAALVHMRGASAEGLLSQAPQGLVAAAAADVPSGGRLVVQEAWGSWFEYALPSDPVFVDPRIELFPTGVWEDYTTLRLAKAGWADVLDRWGVDGVVVDDRAPQLGRLLAGDARWRLAYSDADGQLYVRS
jgi:hypothetical protein